jgi:hypothetical protein
MKNQDELLAQLAAIVTLGEKILAETFSDEKQKQLVNESKFHEFRISALSFLSRVFGEGTTLHQSFKSEVTQATASRTRRGLGFLAATAKELQGDWLETTTGAINRDLLADMLRLAKTHLDERRPRAAAILAAAILEKHLRNLCLAKGIKIYNEIGGKAVDKKGLQLTGEAYKKKFYDRSDNKGVTIWLTCGEQAADPKGAEPSLDQVKTMISGIASFLNKVRY